MNGSGWFCDIYWFHIHLYAIVQGGNWFDELHIWHQYCPHARWHLFLCIPKHRSGIHRQHVYLVFRWVFFIKTYLNPRPLTGGCNCAHVMRWILHIKSSYNVHKILCACAHWQFRRELPNFAEQLACRYYWLNLFICICRWVQRTAV